MKFLVPIGGFVDSNFGTLATPGTYGIQANIRAGYSWAADNQAFTKKFDLERFKSWLQIMEPYRETCLFVTVPDVVGDAQKTLNLFDRYCHSFPGWRLAFAAQNGQELLEFPDSNTWQVLFVGGSTKWKESESAISVIKRAQAIDKHIHIGRVNYRRRYDLFDQISGSEEFTCDGTRTRFEGTAKTLKSWLEYQTKTRVLKLW